MPSFSDNTIVPIVLMKIYCEDDTIRYATFDTSTDEGAYLESLVTSTVSRKFDILGYSFESNRASINVQNADEKFIRLLSEKSLYGRKVELFAGINGQNLEDMALAFTGKVQNRGTSNGNGSISFYDVRPNLPNVPKNPLTKSDFPSLPSGSSGNKVGLLSGKIADTDNIGRLNLVKVSSSEYFVCVGRAIAIDNVYVDGAAKVEGTANDYIVKHSNYAEKIGFHVLVKFNSGKEPPDDAIVTANVRGMGYDYVKLKGSNQLVATGQHVVDSYGLDLDGSWELAWRDGGIWTSGDSLTIQASVQPHIFANFRSICGQEHQYEGGARGFWLYIGSDGKVRLDIAKTDSNHVNTLVASTALSTTAQTKIKATFDNATNLARIYYDTGSGFVQVGSATWTDTNPMRIWKRFIVGATWKNVDSTWINHFDGVIEYVKFAPSGQVNTNEITGTTHEWHFEQNLNDSVGSSHLTGVNIDGSDYVEVTGHDTPDTYQLFYPYIGSTSPTDYSAWDWSSSKALTMVWRIRTPPAVTWVAGETTTHQWAYCFYQSNSAYAIYNPSTKGFTVRFRNAADTAWFDVYNSTLEEPLFETGNYWKLIVFTADLDAGISKIFVNGHQISSYTFAPEDCYVRNSGAALRWIRYASGTYLGPSECDVDYLGIAPVYVGDRRFPFPVESEFKGFWDWNDAEKDTSGKISPCSRLSTNTDLAVGVSTTNGYNGSVTEGVTHNFGMQLYKPAEDIRDLLHYIGEPLDHNSMLAALSAHESIISDVGDGGKSLNLQGQWGSIISGTARELIRDFTLNCDTQIFQKPDSIWFLKYIDFNSSPPGGDVYSYLENIEKEYWDLRFQSDLKNNRRIEWSENLSGVEGDEYLGGAKAQIIESKTRLGQWYYDQPLKLKRIRGAEAAKSIGLSILRKQASEIPKIAFKTGLKPVDRLIEGNDLGETILVSHPKGVGGQERWGLQFDGSGTDRIFGENKAWPGPTDLTTEFKYTVKALQQGVIWCRSNASTWYNQQFCVYHTVGGGVYFLIGDNVSTYVTKGNGSAIFDEVGKTAVIRISYDYSTTELKFFVDDKLVSTWATSATMQNIANCLEGTGTRAANGGTAPLAGIIHYVRISYSYQPDDGPIKDVDLTFHPSKDGAPYITEERSLLLTTQSSKEPLPVKVQNPGFDKQPCAIEGITYDFLKGQCSVNAVALGFVQSGGEFILDVADPGDPGGGGDGGGGVDPPDPEPQYEYYDLPSINCSLKWVYDGGGNVTSGHVWHGSDTAGYRMRGQMTANISNFTEELLSAKLYFYVAEVVTPRENIKIHKRSIDVGSIYPDLDAGLSSYYGEIGNGVGDKTVNLNSTALTDIFNAKGSSLMFGMQNTAYTPINKWKITSATLVLSVRRSI